MATINKDFKIKNGLVVEGLTATVNGFDVLTKSAADDSYIVGLIGGEADSANTPNSVVKRDGNGDFAAGTVTAEDALITPVVQVGNDNDYRVEVVSGDLDIHSGDDIILNAQGSVYVDSIGSGNVVATSDSAKEIAANLLTSAIKSNISITKDGSNNLTITAENGVADLTTDDLDEGTTNKYFTEERVKNVLTGSTQTNIVIQEIAGQLHITAENGVEDSTTDDLDEGTTNKYFTEARVRGALTGGNGITFNGSTGDISADLGSGLTISAEEIVVDRAVVDTWYDASGAAATAQETAEDYADSLAGNYDPAGSAATAQSNAESTASGYVSTHSGLTSGVHGVTGDVVGTSDTQTLTNKTIGDALTFNDGSSSSTIDVNGNNLSISASDDLTLSTSTGDIILNPDNFAYIGSASDGNKIATNAYVDNAVSGLDWKQSVNVLAVANVSLSGSTPLSVDSHTLDDGYRVLLTGQSTNSENGIYDLSISGGSYTLTRSADADAFGELVGAAVFVMEGTQYNNTSWVQSNHYLTDFTSQSWTQFSGSGSVVAGTGITVDGLEVSIDRTTVDTWYDEAGAASTEVGNHNVSSGVHGVSGDIVGTSDSQTLTNKTISGSSNTISNIGNSSLTNDSITVNGYLTALGSSVTLDTDDIAEGSNEYYTSAKVDGVISTSIASGALYTAISTAQSNAEDYADGLASNYDPAGSAATALQDAKDYADALDTDDVAEGTTNHYFTDGRAKTAAANLLTNSILSNITITGDGDGLVITAENGVADSTTDDLDEGSTNLYFTNARAQSAVAGDITSAINGLDTDDIEEGSSNLYFTDARVTSAISSAAEIQPQAVDITWVRREEGTWTNVPTAGTVTAHTFSASEGSVKYLVRVYNNNKSQLSEVLVTTDSSHNIAITEYGTIYTSASELATISADWDAGTSQYRLRVTTANNASEVLVAATMLAYND